MEVLLDKIEDNICDIIKGEDNHNIYQFNIQVIKIKTVQANGKHVEMDTNAKKNLHRKTKQKLEILLPSFQLVEEN